MFLSSRLGQNGVKLFHSVCLQFKESALRKQSLYLKFDPLLRESPKKCGGAAANFLATRAAAAAASLSQYDTFLFTVSLLPQDGSTEFVLPLTPVTTKTDSFLTSLTSESFVFYTF